MTDYVTPDFYVESHGSIFLLRPRNDAARSWIDDNLYTDEDNRPQWFGDAVAIEHRYIDDIVIGINDAGLEVVMR